MLKKILIYAGTIAGVELVGILGALFTAPAIQGWYGTVAKPSFNPPNWVFGPVWTLLFALIGISLALVITTPADSRIKQKAYAAFAVQLLLNLSWSIIFFGLHAIGWAAVEIILLLASIVVNMYYAGKANRIAGWLLAPYLVWVSFATVLTFSIWMLNR